MRDIVTLLVVVAFSCKPLITCTLLFLYCVRSTVCIHTSLNTHTKAYQDYKYRTTTLRIYEFFMCNNSNAITTKGEQNVERDFLGEAETRSTFLGVSSPFIDLCSKLALQNTTIDFSFYYYSLENCCKL